ncbi:MAG: protein-disulfide reductase DsbD domain-containing protein [Gemmatimonas sp.]
MSHSLRTIFAAAAMVVALAPRTHAQVMPIEWSARVAPGEVRAGRPFTVLVRAQIPYSWHLYSTTQPSGGPMATTFLVSGGPFTRRGKVEAREPIRAYDAIAEMKTETYSDSVTFRVPVVASQSGKQTLELTVRYQSCTDRFCAPERIQVLKPVVFVAPAAGKP